MYIRVREGGGPGGVYPPMEVFLLCVYVCLFYSVHSLSSGVVF